MTYRGASLRPAMSRLGVVAVTSVLVLAACGGSSSRSGVGHGSAECRTTYDYETRKTDTAACEAAARQEARFVCAHTHSAAVEVDVTVNDERHVTSRMDC